MHLLDLSPRKKRKGKRNKLQMKKMILIYLVSSTKLYLKVSYHIDQVLIINRVNDPSDKWKMPQIGIRSIKRAQHDGRWSSNVIN